MFRSAIAPFILLLSFTFPRSLVAAGTLRGSPTNGNIAEEDSIVLNPLSLTDDDMIAFFQEEIRMGYLDRTAFDEMFLLSATEVDIDDDD